MLGPDGESKSMNRERERGANGKPYLKKRVKPNLLKKMLKLKLKSLLKNLKRLRKKLRSKKKHQWLRLR